MPKKLSNKLSLVLVTTTVIVTTLFAVYFCKQQTGELNETILDKGALSAQQGARISESVLAGLLKTRRISPDNLFDGTLIPIVYPATVQNSYKKYPEKILRKYQKFNYANGLDSILDRVLTPLQDAFLVDPQLRYAFLVDANGYVPSHNSRYAYPPDGTLERDIALSRSKRIFSDKLGIQAARNKEQTVLLQFHTNDMGERLWDISSPVLVGGRHWGAFRIGVSLAETTAAKDALRNKLVVFVVLLTLLIAIVLHRMTDAVMRPLGDLLTGVQKVSNGDLSYRIPVMSRNEIGVVAEAFNQMNAKLRTHMENLQKATFEKERIEIEFRIARQIQTSMLPRSFPASPKTREFDLYASLDTAKDVGGDFYDFFFINDTTLCFYVGDVSGKGIPASLYMAVTRTLIRSKATRRCAPSDILTSVNNELCTDNESCMFTTAFLALLDIFSGELSYSNAGHPPPLFQSGKQNFTFLTMQNNGRAMGITQGSIYSDMTLELQRYDTLFLYTNGVIEARNRENEEFGYERLQHCLTDYGRAGPTRLAEHVVRTVVSFTASGAITDDIAIVALRYVGGKPG